MNLLYYVMYDIYNILNVRIPRKNKAHIEAEEGKEIKKREEREKVEEKKTREIVTKKIIRRWSNPSSLWIKNIKKINKITVTVKWRATARRKDSCEL